MKNINDAIARIKILQCPTGDVKNRISGILKDYGVANENEVIINRNEGLDTIEAEAYSAKINRSGETIVVLARSGGDDYVAEVVDAYISGE